MLSVGCFYAATGEAERAARWLGAAEREIERHPGAVQPADLAERDRVLSRTRTLLGTKAFEALWHEGQQAAVAELLPGFEQDTPARAPAAGAAPDPARPQSAPAPAHSAAHQILSDRERDVLRLLAQGLSYAEIGKLLFISPRTVDTHLRSIYGKLNVRSRHEAARYAIDHGLV